jgi:predicted transporter
LENEKQDLIAVYMYTMFQAITVLMRITNSGHQVLAIAVICHVCWAARRLTNAAFLTQTVSMDAIMIGLLRWKFVNVV